MERNLSGLNASSDSWLCTRTKTADDADYMQELCHTLALNFTRRVLTTFATSSALVWSALH
jgi:hypothetical protein